MVRILWWSLSNIDTAYDKVVGKIYGWVIEKEKLVKIYRENKMLVLKDRKFDQCKR